MDLTTLTLFLTLIASAIGVDTVLHPTSILLSATATGKFEKITVDSKSLDDMLVYEVSAICSTPSVMAVPEVRGGPGHLGVGMAIARSFKMQPVAVALQSQFGYQPDEIRLTLLGEDGAIKMMVTGSGLGGRINTPPFELTLAMQPKETIAELVHRAAVAGMTLIDPYVTALYLLERHIGDGNFSDTETLINKTLTQLPPTPVNFDRSVYQNLLGIIALFRGKLDVADTWFEQAIAADPNDTAAILNAAFVDIHLGKFKESAAHMQTLLTRTPPEDTTLLATAYLTWGAALMGLGDLQQADEKLARAVSLSPRSASSYALWSDVKRVLGDKAAADRLQTKALEVSGSFENYAELAALYFQVSWKEGETLQRNPFNKTGMIRYN